MNRKKHNYMAVISGILFLVIACIISHSVIPHHSHGSVLCTALYHNHSGEDTHSGEGHSPFSQEEGCCQLDNVVVRDSDTQEEVYAAIPLLLTFIHYHTGNCCEPKETQVFNYLQYKPYYGTFYTSYVVPTLGLRASPYSIKELRS